MIKKIFILIFLGFLPLLKADTLKPSDIEVLRNEFDALSYKKKPTTYQIPQATKSSSRSSLDSLPNAPESFVDLDSVFNDDSNTNLPKRKR